jgi:hypothetical protein
VTFAVAAPVAATLNVHPPRPVLRPRCAGPRAVECRVGRVPVSMPGGRYLPSRRSGSRWRPYARAARVRPGLARRHCGQTLVARWPGPNRSRPSTPTAPLSAPVARAYDPASRGAYGLARLDTNIAGKPESSSDLCASVVPHTSSLRTPQILRRLQGRELRVRRDRCRELEFNTP